MWQCPQCEASVDRSMDVCWRCGCDADGNENPDFDSQADDIEEPTVPAFEPDEGPPNLQVTLRTLFVLTSICAVLLTAMTRSMETLVLVMIGVGLANSAGILVGAFITAVLRIPNDGSTSWDDEER